MHHEVSYEPSKLLFHFLPFKGTVSVISIASPCKDLQRFSLITEARELSVFLLINVRITAKRGVYASGLCELNAAEVSCFPQKYQVQSNFQNF